MNSLIQRIKSKLRSNPRHVSEILWVCKMFSFQKDGVMIDVGAHFGESFQSFSERGWRVVAFEPDALGGKHEAIRKKLNGKSESFSFALSDAEAESCEFYVSEVSTGISGLLPFHPSHTSSQRVPVKTLASVLGRLGITKVDFLKIDTEGNDLPVLRGLAWSVRPDVILCEFEDAKTKLVGYDYRDLGDYLVEAGYSVFMSEWYPIKKYGTQHAWRRLGSYPCRLEDSNSWGNYLAVLPERADQLLETAKSFGVRLNHK